MSDPNPELDPAYSDYREIGHGIGCAATIGLCILLGSVVIIASVVDWATGGRLLGG